MKFHSKTLEEAWKASPLSEYMHLDDINHDIEELEQRLIEAGIFTEISVPHADGHLVWSYNGSYQVWHIYYDGCPLRSCKRELREDCIPALAALIELAGKK